MWRGVLGADGSNSAPEAVTGGDGIETQPVVASDGATVAVAALRCARADARGCGRGGCGKLIDLAPQAVPADFPGSAFCDAAAGDFHRDGWHAIHGQLFLAGRPQAGRATSGGGLLSRRIAPPDAARLALHGLLQQRLRG